ncbi:MAG: CoA-binding protein [Melioribacteraceae bacterium]|nr:CoA-binding protein [Melioribacteraceae bacterium]
MNDTDTIAVVGISKHYDRTSRSIARYLKSAGYKVYGVNPTCDAAELDGIPVYKSLNDIPVIIDIVNVFRRSEDIPGIISDVIEVKPKTLWLQLGIRNDEAVKPLVEWGINVVQDTCIYVEHSNCF